MYSEIKNVQILISLLKENGIKRVVLSPGGSDIPIIHSLECDSFFECHSVVDERSAAYYALGLSQETSETVACVCTSGTAICNYLPGITEAYYQNTPLVAITCDKNPYFQGQLETQKIEQTKAFNGVVKMCVDLPLIKSADDEWLCNRLINEALLEVNHHGSGPVQINIPVLGDTSSYISGALPKERIINRINQPINEDTWNNYMLELTKKKRIMVVVGQNINFSIQMEKDMSDFFAKFNCIFAVEHLSNLNCEGKIYTYPITEMGGLNEELIPDLVISIGNNLSSYQLKPFLRKNYQKMENWLIDPSGKVRDAYKSLTKIFECSIEQFFREIIKIPTKTKNDGNYYNAWNKYLAMVKIPQLPFSSMLVAEKLSKNLPEKAILHLAILNSTRLMQFFEIPHNVRVYSNVGALGIDGCMATFAGQAASTEEKAYLLIGDLSFFYGMNAAALKSIKNNVRIILLNNGGGSEFHFFMGKEVIPTIDQFICAKHGCKAEGWIKSLGYDYYSVKNEEELDFVINLMKEDSNNPIFVEVFTDMEDDAKKINKIYKDNTYNFSINYGGLTGLKNAVISKLSKEQEKKIKKIVKKIKR